MKVKFKCPQCGNSLLIQTELQLELWSVEEVYDDYVETGDRIDSSGYDCHIPEYLCCRCWFQIPAQDPEELLNWLKERNMVEEEDEQ